MGNNEYLIKLTERYDGDDVIKYSLISITFTVLVFFLYFFKGYYFGLPADVYLKYFAPVNTTMQKIYIVYLCCYIILSLILIYKAFSEIVYTKFDLFLALSFAIPSAFIFAYIIYLIGMTDLSSSMPILSIVLVIIYAATAILSVFHIKRNIALNRIPKTYNRKTSIIVYCCTFAFFFSFTAFDNKIPPVNPLYKRAFYAVIFLLLIEYIIILFLYKYRLKNAEK